MPFLIPLLLVLSFQSFCHASAQQADLLVYKGKLYFLYSTPLERNSYSILVGGLCDFIGSSNGRRHVALWEIDGRKLYLKALDATDEGMKIGLHDLPKLWRKWMHSKPPTLNVENNRALADWFTGRLRCPLGKVLKFVNTGFDSVFERDLFLYVEKGVLKKTELIVNQNPKDSDESKLNP